MVRIGSAGAKAMESGGARDVIAHLHAGGSGGDSAAPAGVAAAGMHASRLDGLRPCSYNRPTTCRTC